MWTTGANDMRSYLVLDSENGIQLKLYSQNAGDYQDLISVQFFNNVTGAHKYIKIHHPNYKPTSKLMKWPIDSSASDKKLTIFGLSKICGPTSGKINMLIGLGKKFSFQKNLLVKVSLIDKLFLMFNFISHLQFLFLKNFYHINTDAPVSEYRLSLDKIFTDDFPQKISGKFVVDFGCGLGADTKKMAEWGAKLSLGLEIREELVKANSERIKLSNCAFATAIPADLKSQADLIISIDAFEHFSEPANMLKIMLDCLRPGGLAYISFGPTWYHPHGGHAFSVFPWAHLLFTEKALITWRNQFYHDGATRFHEVSGGLNKISIAEFEHMFKQSGFLIEDLYCKPIKGQKLMQKIFGREFMTSMVLVRLKKP